MKKIILIFIGIFLINSARSQTTSPELISSGGESFENSTYKLNWSIGESVTATHIAGDYVITSGFHQESYVITSVEDLATDINISIYPNPTTDIITVAAGGLSELQDPVYLTVNNLNGKVLLKEEINKQEKQLNFSAYTGGVYFLTVKQKNQVIKTFKIIKK